MKKRKGLKALSPRPFALKIAKIDLLTFTITYILP